MRFLNESCLELRARLADTMTGVLTTAEGQSEEQVAQNLKTQLASIPGVLPAGWYSPPPTGIGMLFADPHDNYRRGRFDSLRNEQYWPKADYKLGDETIGILYASPVWATSGIIGDWGATLYRGKDTAIQQHLVNCLEAVEEMSEYAQVGMQLGDMSRFADTMLKKRGLASDRVVLTSKTDVTGINCGHTIPWTDSPPTAEEARVLESGAQRAINQLISSKRVFINANETMVIPKTIVFTSELRLESTKDPQLPNGYFHMLVSFLEGEKTIAADFNAFFKAMGMDYIRSKF